MGSHKPYYQYRPNGENMAFYHNHVTLSGNLTRNPELRTAGNGQVAQFGLAVNRRYRIGDEWQEQVSFIDCETWNQAAEWMARSLQKGDPVFVEGRLQMDSWTNKEGRQQTRLKVVATGVRAYVHRSRSEGRPATAQSTNEPQPAYQHSDPQPAYPASNDGYEDEAPF